LADAEALVHIGHVISTDVGLSPHFNQERMRLSLSETNPAGK
jgi:hypothetical protein